MDYDNRTVSYHIYMIIQKESSVISRYVTFNGVGYGLHHEQDKATSFSSYETAVDVFKSICHDILWLNKYKYTAYVKETVVSTKQIA